MPAWSGSSPGLQFLGVSPSWQVPPNVFDMPGMAFSHPWTVSIANVLDSDAGEQQPE